MAIQLSNGLFMALADERLRARVLSKTEGLACGGVGVGRGNRGVCISSEFIYRAVT